MSTLLYRQKKNSLLLSLVLILFVMVAGLSALFFLNENQDIRQQAWLGNNDLGSKCAGGDCETDSSSDGIFISSQENYKIDLATNTNWKKASDDQLKDLTGNEPSLFTYRNEFGFATVFLDMIAFEAGQTRLDLRQLAEIIEEKFINNDNYVGKELVDLGERTVIRYEFTEEFIGKKATYYEYLIPSKNGYLEAEVRFTPSARVDQELTSFLNSITFVNEDKGFVKGATTDKVNFAESEIAELVKPSVANILHLYCKELRLSAELPTNYLQRSYGFCDGNYGSGFLVDGSGLLATNGHVVTTFPEQDLIGGLNQGNQAIVTFVIDFVREALASQGLATTPEEGLAYTSQMMSNPSGVQVLVQSIYELLDTKAIEIVPVAEKYFVNLGNEPFEFSAKTINPTNINSFVDKKEAIFDADLVATNYANLFSKDVVLGNEKAMGSDVALLKIVNSDNYTYPSLYLGEASDLKEGDAILVIGFPGVVSGSDSGPMLIDYTSSSTKATVTRGIVSAIKKDNQGNVLIQTDATIGHGNSGGPAFNDKGEVIGIATYGIMDEVGSFNFLRDIEDLKKLAEEQASPMNANASETYQNWEKALGFYWNNRFTKSLEFLTKVEESYPVHPTVGEIEKEAADLIADGKDVDLIFGINKTVFYIFGGLLSLILIVGVVVVIIKKKKPQPIVMSVQPDQQPVAEVANLRAETVAENTLNQPVDTTTSISVGPTSEPVAQSNNPPESVT